jgi:hypothetical protein
LAKMRHRLWSSPVVGWVEVEAELVSFVAVVSVGVADPALLRVHPGGWSCPGESVSDLQRPDSGVDVRVVSRRRESHPPPLVEPCVTVSRHTAPVVEPLGMAPCRQ